MRIGYSGEEDYPGQFGLWQGNCQRSLHGKAGQSALRELESALLALPDKRLIAERLQDDWGDVCAIGAVAKQRNIITEEMKADAEHSMERVGEDLGMPRLVAWKVVEQNDLYFNGNDLVLLEGPYRWPAERPYVYAPITPEQRYGKMLAWVQSQIVAI
jgi:hypothetical protein